MDRFTGRAAVVTGGARGIGRAVVEQLLHEGGSAIIAPRRPGDRVLVEPQYPCGHARGHAHPLLPGRCGYGLHGLVALPRTVRGRGAGRRGTRDPRRRPRQESGARRSLPGPVPDRELAAGPVGPGPFRARLCGGRCRCGRLAGGARLPAGGHRPSGDRATSGSSPQWSTNPQTGAAPEWTSPADGRAALHAVHHDPERPSRLVLTVVPA